MSKLASPHKTLSGRIRLALIPVLSLALAACLWWPTPKSGTATVAANTTVMDISTGRPMPQSKAAQFDWPTSHLAEVVAFDLFEPLHPQLTEQLTSPPVDADNEKHSHEEAARQPALGPLQAVYRDSYGATAAIIGSRVVRVGDVLPEVGRVVEITDREILVERE